QRDDWLKREIQRVYDENHQVYGVRKVWRQLLREGIRVARCTVARLMAVMGLAGVLRGKKVRTTVSRKAVSAGDRVNRQFVAERPDQLWVADFTYVSTWQGFVYVAFIIDVFAGCIVGWRVSSSMETTFVLDALEQALWARRPSGTVHHSDKGSQYISLAYTERLKEAKLLASTGSTGDSYDNAMAESINGLYKAEVIHRKSWKNRAEVELATLTWVDWYNNRRLLGRLGHIPPAEAEKAENFMSAGYKNFLAEVNNLNKRMGDLRDINGEAGAWARIMSGTGSASGGFSDNYTHVQVGVDKKHELDGLDLFTGFTVTHTDSSASADVFSGKTKSVGAGLYASAMFDSGAYIDLIGKYVHHDNEYTATFAGLGTRDYSTHSWYAGAEAGYRYHVTEDAWIEPQAELVYGSVSGKQFAWKDQGMHLSMKDKDYNPLIGRTGVDVGKSFSGKDWKVTARAGLGYQFDLLANGETVLRDASGEKRIKGEKDSRMLMSVGLNAEIRDNVRFGLEFEKSAFGKYNVDNAVNANFRYSF
ncbi:IS3 family transposase, partial [Escherichia coli]|nr:IS3 family transposase [Escherichia coli]